ncbi:multicopper oxidase family protein [Streptomyces sp. NPDC051243]|uniref:multicopper oxidase family protein n=1 Tax=Streptomyces sp. NPDC051243 TaxID=3365646 RepID=UPI0037949A3B
MSTRLVRLRLLNASSARSYNFGFTDNRPLSVVATDAGLLPAPVDVTRLLLSPSERAEIVVAVRPGDRGILRSYPTGLGGGILPDRFAGGDDSFDILRLAADRRLTGPAALPERLPGPPPVQIPADAPRRVFTFNHASRISGRHFDPGRIDFTIAPGAREVWELRNSSDNQHVFHVHGLSFTVLSRDGSPPPVQSAGLKDSVLLPSGTTTLIALRFGTDADSRAPYMFHCHVLAHEDHGMMGQFTVVGAAR